ncbi:hypothetical protein [Streptomyces sp. NPDC048663]|uniref:Rv1733c family protein n=1 Tax=Streptomyces sp. NPDC048663 TaxID=3155638 RepID=UPI00343E0EE6
MRGAENAKKPLWRWRSNPLRRHDDVVEAWVVLAVWALVSVGGTLAGMVTAQSASEVFARQRADRRPVQAVLLTGVPRSLLADGETSERGSAAVRYLAPDGSTRSGVTRVESGLRAGGSVVVWEDGRGRLTTEPPSATAAGLEAGVLGTAAACAAAGTVLGAGAVARWRLDRRRIALWEREWALVGPRWSHRTG